MFLDMRVHPNARFFRCLLDGEDITFFTAAADTDEGWVEVPIDSDPDIDALSVDTEKRYGKVILYQPKTLSCPRCRTPHECYDQAPKLEHQCHNPVCGFSFTPAEFPTLGVPRRQGQTRPPKDPDIFEAFGLDPDDFAPNDDEDEED